VLSKRQRKQIPQTREVLTAFDATEVNPEKSLLVARAMRKSLGTDTTMEDLDLLRAWQVSSSGGLLDE
jgi:hypothetical protein